MSRNNNGITLPKAKIPESAQPNLEGATMIKFVDGPTQYAVDQDGKPWVKARPVFADNTMAPADANDPSKWPWQRLDEYGELGTKVIDERRRKARLGELKTAA